MSRRGPLGHLLFGSAVAAVALTVAAGTGQAATAEAAGWWTGAPLALAPDAPTDALVIEGGVTEPRSYGALRYSLSPGERALTLTISLAAGGASTPNTTLRLCRLTELFRPVRGGSIADAPAYDCETSVEVEPSEDGTTYEFDVGGLVLDDELAVAVLPTAVTDRVLLSTPDSDSLTTMPAAPTPERAASSTPPSGGGAAPTSVPVQSAADSGERVTQRPAVGAVVPSAGREAPAVSSGTTPTTPATTASIVPSRPAVPDSPADAPDGASWLPPTLFIGLAALAAVLWAGRGHDDDLDADGVDPSPAALLRKPLRAPGFS